MSIINLGFQSIGLMRTRMSEEAERELKNCNSLVQLRISGGKHKEEIKKSLQAMISLLSDIVRRLELKKKKFEIFESASDDDILNFWELLQTVDSTLTRDDTTKKNIKNKDDLKSFFDHCCQARHYSFSIKKCGEDSCAICKPVRMPKEEFEKLKHLPDPMIGENEHYKPFEEVFGTTTTEKDRPSLSNSKNVQVLSFSPTVRHVKNVDVMVQLMRRM